MEKDIFFTKLFEQASKIGVELTNNQLENFYTYMNLLIEWNEKINLTAIIEPNDIILKHFVDSIIANKYINDEKQILDIGSGAGFPGIPLKIINESKNFILLDSLNKRINFLNIVKEQLNLENLECIHSRIEDFAKNNINREKFDIVTSRAVARLNVLVEYMLPFVKIGGSCICMKGIEIEEELQEANKAIKVLGGEIQKVDKFYLPNSDIGRSIVIIRKIKPTSTQYPRKAGVPSKNPIC